MTDAEVLDAPAPAFASLGARFAAGVIDVGVITLPSLIISQLLASSPFRAGDAAITVLSSLYFILSYSSVGGGYSVGKMVVGIRVVNAAGDPLSVADAAVRWFLSVGIALPLAFLVIGFERGTPVRTGPAFALGVPILCVIVIDSYLCGAHTTSHRSLHDICAGSSVVKRAHAGALPPTEPIARWHYPAMALLCAAIAWWFSHAYPWARAVGQRSLELMKARTVALATGRAASLVVAPAFQIDGADTTWVVNAMAKIHAKPETEFAAEALRKSLACALAREAPMSFRGAELNLLATFDPGSRPTEPGTMYVADLELTPEACKPK